MTMVCNLQHQHFQDSVRLFDCFRGFRSSVPFRSSYEEPRDARSMPPLPNVVNQFFSSSAASHSSNSVTVTRLSPLLYLRSKNSETCWYHKSYKMASNAASLFDKFPYTNLNRTMRPKIAHNLVIKSDRLLWKCHKAFVQIRSLFPDWLAFSCCLQFILNQSFVH